MFSKKDVERAREEYNKDKREVSGKFEKLGDRLERVYKAHKPR